MNDETWEYTSPDWWTDADVGHAKAAFHNDRPAASKASVHRLWQYWRLRLRSADRRVFEDSDEDDVSLVLHGRAYGEDVPWLNDPGPYGELLVRHQDQFTRPLTPPPLPFGPVGVLSPAVESALDSPVPHVWVYLEQGTPRKIVIVGRGVAEIEQRLLQHAQLSTARIHQGLGTSEDLHQIGVLRLAGQGTLEPLEIPPIRPQVMPEAVGGGSQTSETAARTAGIELAQLRGTLTEIANKTGLIEVHSVDMESADTGLRGTLSAIAEAPNDGSIRIWAPGNSASPGVDVVPYLKMPRGQLYGAFHGDLLRAHAFQELVRRYFQDHAQQNLIDLAVRWEKYHEHEQNQLLERARWDEAAEAARAAHRDDVDEYRYEQWGRREVVLTISWNSVIGTFTVLAEPEHVDLKVFYEQHVPVLLQSQRAWRMRMEAQARSYIRAVGLQTAVDPPVEAEMEDRGRLTFTERFEHNKQREQAVRMWFEEVIRQSKGPPAGWRLDTPFARAITSRFIDAALRGRRPLELGNAESSFTSWSSATAPLLCMEWRCLLRESHALDADEIFSHQTFFYTHLFPETVGDEVREIEHLGVYPHVVVDRQRSAVIFDARRKVMVVRDATDYSQRVDSSETNWEQLWSKLLLGARDPDSPADVSAFAGELRGLLRRAPRAVSGRIVSDLLGITTQNSAAQESQQLRRALERGDANAEPTRMVSHTLNAMRLLALQTARRSLEALVNHEALANDSARLARAHILRAVLECRAVGWSSETIEQDLPGLWQGGLAAIRVDEVMKALAAARHANREETEKLIDILRRTAVPRDVQTRGDSHGFHFQTLLQRLIEGLARPWDWVDDEASVALLATGAAEDARLARDLQRAASELAPFGESAWRELVTLGPAVEDAMFPEFGGGAAYGLLDVTAILTGHEPLPYGLGANR